MKLKKILALALSGILAVSMLAGCGSTVITNKNVTRDSGRVVASVNDSLKQLDVTFKSDSDFASKLATVANNATLDDVKSLATADYLTGSAQSTLTYITKAKWMQSAPTEKGTYVCGIWFDGSKSAYEVGSIAASYLDQAAAITETFNVTEASVEAYKVTLGTGDAEKDVWLVGILVTLAEKSST